MKAERKSRLAVRPTRYWWGELYTGSVEQLVATGLAVPSWFPGQPGNNKVAQSVVLEPGAAPVLCFGPGRNVKASPLAEVVKIQKNSGGTYTLRHVVPAAEALARCSNGGLMASRPASQYSDRDRVMQTFHDELVAEGETAEHRGYHVRRWIIMMYAFDEVMERLGKMGLKVPT